MKHLNFAATNLETAKKLGINYQTLVKRLSD